MPEATARNWRRAGRIKATPTATGHWRVSLDQLAAVRAMLGLPPEGTAK